MAAAKKPSAKKPPAKKTPAIEPAPSAPMPKTLRIFGMSFASVYPLYVAKAEKKGRTQREVDEIIA